MTKTLLSGMRPTGRLHLGHYSVVENWIELQKEYQCYYFIADWHAVSTAFDDTATIRANSRELTIDWLSAGLSPDRGAIFRQSDVKEHAELHLLFSMITPLSWLERVPTYKDQIVQFGAQGKDIATYGFLGYPLLQAADILVYRAFGVPVGEDQIPHIELTREVARRFNHMYKTDVFPEPQALMPKIKNLPGIDNRKMSKSYANDISLSATEGEVKARVQQMVTDPARIHKTDPGHPDICTVHTYHGFYNQEAQGSIAEACKKGEIGCGECKKCLTAKLNEFLAPIRERRQELETIPGLVEDILAEGASKARMAASETMARVREAMKI